MNWFATWQKERLAHAETLPRERAQYGLSIAVENPELDTAVASGGAAADIETSLKPYVDMTAEPIDRDYYFAKMAGCGSPNVYVFEKGEHTKEITAEGNTFSIVLAKAGADVSVVTTPKGDAFTGHTLILIAQDDANIDCEHRTEGRKTFFANTIAIAERDAWITVVERYENPAFVRSYTTFSLGEGAEGKVDTRMRAKEGSTIDISHVSRHRKSYSRAQLVSRGVADTGGKIVYRGDIEIEDGIGGIESHQEGKFLMEGEGAEIDAIPALDINSKDVVCSHAVSITYPREDLLYYTALRGLDEAAGRKLLVQSLLGS